MEKLALTLTELREAGSEVHPEPTEPQKDAGNYKKGHVRWKGLGLTIESAKGQYRRGVTKDGVAWKTLMRDHYGYIKGTLSEADGDHIDVFLSEENLESELIFVINQYVGGKFDEVKCVLGTVSESQARTVYTRNYQAGWDGLASVVPMTLPQFKKWIIYGDTSRETIERDVLQKAGAARFALSPGVPDLVADEGSLPESSEQALQVLRSQGDHRLSKMAEELSRVLPRYGTETAGDDVGAEEYKRRLQPDQLYLGIETSAVEKQAEQSLLPIQREVDGFSGLGERAGHQQVDAEGEAPAVRLDQEAGVHYASDHDLTEYKCPHCGGVAYNGDPKTGNRFRGSGACVDCGEGFSIVGLKLQPVEKRAALLPGVQLRPHQQEVAETGLRDNTHMLLYHDLGSGKSLSSLAAAEATGDPYTAVTPASLRPNYRKEQEKFTDQTTPNNLVSYNSVAKGQVPPTDTLIFDEAQRLRNPNSLTTQNATQLADEAKRVYLLSGTPIVNRPNELAPMIRMLTGKNFSPEEFDSKFVDERKISPGLFGWLRGVKPVKAPQMKNKEEFDDLMQGHVHYFAPDKPAVETEEEHIVTDMGPEQTKLYKAFWDQLPWVYRWKLQNSYPLTRQEMTRLSSFLSGPRQVGLSTLPFMRGKADPLRAFNQSPKLQRAMAAMKSTLDSDPNARGMIFSNFIDAGLKPYGAALDQAKIPYGMFHGGLNDAARKKVVDDYNANRIRAILVGPSGGEGISLKGTRMMQILDPHWNSARTDQAVGRGVRFDSHNYLDPEDRNVKVQRYVSQLPPSTWQKMWRSVFGVRKQEDARRTSPGVDTYLEQMAERKDTLNEQFLKELQRIGSTSRLDKAAADAMAEELAETMRQEEADERPFTVAVDLDGTLAESLVPHDPETIGAVRPKVKEWMEKFRAAGARLIIFTVRDGDELVTDWLEENEIPYDYINENPDQPDGSSGKIIADVYLDDRAVDASGDWDDHGKVVLQRVKAASTVTSREPDLIDSIVAELTKNGSSLDYAAVVAV